eukprot:scaffold790_cov387-Prasinococcus_capsulatus_cf.AAC.8
MGLARDLVDRAGDLGTVIAFVNGFDARRGSGQISSSGSECGRKAARERVINAGDFGIVTLLASGFVLAAWKLLAEVATFLPTLGPELRSILLFTGRALNLGKLASSCRRMSSLEGSGPLLRDDSGNVSLYAVETPADGSNLAVAYTFAAHHQSKLEADSLVAEVRISVTAWMPVVVATKKQHMSQTICHVVQHTVLTALPLRVAKFPGWHDPPELEET